MSTDQLQPPPTRELASSTVPPATSTATTKDFSLHVVYVTSTSIFIPEIMCVAPRSTSAATMTSSSSQSTLLHQLASEDSPEQTLANIVGATSAAGSGLMVHIFRFPNQQHQQHQHQHRKQQKTQEAADPLSTSGNNLNDDNNNNNNSNYDSRSNDSNNYYYNKRGTNSSSFARIPTTSSSTSPSSPSALSLSLPPLVAVLDEEEGTNRGIGSVVSPLNLEKRVMSIKKHVKSLRFLPDELGRFLHSASLDQDTTEIARNLVDALIPASGEQHLAAVAGVLVGKLPKLRIQQYEEGATFMKVLVR